MKKGFSGGFQKTDLKTALIVNLAHQFDVSSLNVSSLSLSTALNQLGQCAMRVFALFLA
jgi:hypothetical protein